MVEVVRMLVRFAPASSSETWLALGLLQSGGGREMRRDCGGRGRLRVGVAGGGWGGVVRVEMGRLLTTNICSTAVFAKTSGDRTCNCRKGCSAEAALTLERSNGLPAPPPAATAAAALAR